MRHSERMSNAVQCDHTQVPLVFIMRKATGAAVSCVGRTMFIDMQGQARYSICFFFSIDIIAACFGMADVNLAQCATHGCSLVNHENCPQMMLLLLLDPKLD